MNTTPPTERLLAACCALVGGALDNGADPTDSLIVDARTAIRDVRLERMGIDERTSKRARLKDAEAAFREAGGRGVALGDEIDDLRWELGLED